MGQDQVGGPGQSRSRSRALSQLARRVAVRHNKDKFFAKPPAAQFQIFLHSNIHQHTPGGDVACAIAGVIPRGSAMFPVRACSSTSMKGTDKPFGAIEQATFERGVHRSAAKSLMDACEVSPSRDIDVKRVR